jgi:hypothetical protein
MKLKNLIVNRQNKIQKEQKIKHRVIIKMINLMIMIVKKIMRM